MGRVVDNCHFGEAHEHVYGADKARLMIRVNLLLVPTIIGFWRIGNIASIIQKHCLSGVCVNEVSVYMECACEQWIRHSMIMNRT